MKANLKSKTNTAIGINPVINDGIYLLEFKYENIVANMPQGLYYLFIYKLYI